MINKQPLYLAVVGSQAKFKTNTNRHDLDLRGPFIHTIEGLSDPFDTGMRPEWRYEEGNKDVDCWEFKYFIRQIVRGDNSSPLLLASLFADDFVEMTEAGQYLVDNRKHFLGENLVKGAVKFCDRKIAQSKRPNQKHPAHKYVYYAISDMLDAVSLLNDEKLHDFTRTPWVLKLKNGKVPIDVGYKMYDLLKAETLKIENKHKIDKNKVRAICLTTYQIYFKI